MKSLAYFDTDCIRFSVKVGRTLLAQIITVYDFSGKGAFLVSHDRSLPTQKNVQNHSALPNIRLWGDFFSQRLGAGQKCLGYDKKYLSFALFDDIFNSEDFGDTEINNFDDILFFAVEDNVLEFEVWVDDAFTVAMTEDIENLLHDVCGSFLRDWGLVFDDGGKGLAKTEFHDNKIPMAVFKEFVDFIEKGMINLFQLIDLLFQSLPLNGPDLILIDHVDRPDEFGLEMYGLTQFIEFVLFQVRGQDLVFRLNGPLNLTNEVVLLELYLLFVFVDIVGWLLKLFRLRVGGSHFLVGSYVYIL